MNPFLNGPCSQISYLSRSALGLVIGTALIFNMAIAGFAGTVVPVTLDKLGIDPALASGTFVTTTTDVMGFFIFLGLASKVLL